MTDVAAELRARARAVLEDHWMPEGYCAPHPARYPWQWLWDSCFHSLVWAELGDERASVELASCFRWQTPAGFVPHMGYQRDPEAARPVWGRAGCSTLTQPPMFGHAAAELARRGFLVEGELLDRMRRALRFLRERRRTPAGLVTICHPWEAGIDDSPRWDGWRAGAASRPAWLERKLALLGPVEVTPDGEALGNPAFSVAPAGFNALVAFNLLELAEVGGDRALEDEGRELAEAVDGLWDEEAATWIDWAPAAVASLRARTLDGLLPVLVSPERDRVARALAQVCEDRAFGGRFGPAGVDRHEETFDPSAYGRGSAWPQLNYLLWVAARRRGFPEVAEWLARRTVEGARRSGLAEHWHPDSGRALGAAPHSWAALSLLMSGDVREGSGRRGDR